MNKRTKKQNLDIESLPNSYFQTAGEILEEDRGSAKLRNRNDKIHAEMQDLCAKHNTKLFTYKEKDSDYIVYHIGALDISVKLINK